MSDRLLARATIFRSLLDRRTRDRPVGAEYAAISLLRGQGFATAVAGVEESAGVGRHGLSHAVPAVRARDLGLELHGTILWQRWIGAPFSASPCILDGLSDRLPVLSLVTENPRDR